MNAWRLQGSGGGKYKAPARTAHGPVCLEWREWGEWLWRRWRPSGTRQFNTGSAVLLTWDFTPRAPEKSWRVLSRGAIASELCWEGSQSLCGDRDWRGHKSRCRELLWVRWWQDGIEIQGRRKWLVVRYVGDKINKLLTEWVGRGGRRWGMLLDLAGTLSGWVEGLWWERRPWKRGRLTTDKSLPLNICHNYVWGKCCLSSLASRCAVRLVLPVL